MKYQYKCTFCNGDAYLGVTEWEDCNTGKKYYKEGDIACMKCHKGITGQKIF